MGRELPNPKHQPPPPPKKKESRDTRDTTRQHNFWPKRGSLRGILFPRIVHMYSTWNSVRLLASPWAIAGLPRLPHLEIELPHGEERHDLRVPQIWLVVREALNVLSHGGAVRVVHAGSQFQGREPEMGLHRFGGARIVDSGGAGRTWEVMRATNR